MRKYIKNLIVDLFVEVFYDSKFFNLLESSVKKQIESSIEKLRYDYLPHGACWMCSNPISREGGYMMWMGKLFCSDNCLEKYHSLIQKPDLHYRYMSDEKGVQHPIETFNPKSCVKNTS